MSEWNYHLRNLEDAEVYFRAVNCSHFFMHRANPDRYAEYISLRVPKRKERAWTRAEFETKIQTLLDKTTDPNDLWWLHSHLTDLAVSIGAEDTAHRLLDATKRIEPLVPDEHRILVAETLVTRAVNSIPIRLFYSHSRHLLLRRCAEMALVFCNGSSAPIGGPSIASRKAQALEKVARLTKMLEPWWKFWD